MPFRITESKADGLKRAMNYFVDLPNNRMSETEKEKARAYLEYCVKYIGPVVHAYPVWHPLVSSGRKRRQSCTLPEWECGYKGLDHTIYFTNGFITCPYSDGEDIIDAVSKLRCKVAEITAQKLKTVLYATGTTPVLVRCRWKFGLLSDLTIPSRVAVALMLQKQLQYWEKSTESLPWERACYSLLGSPHGQLSSLFVNRETGLKMRKVWQAVCAAGVFGKADPNVM